MHAASRHSMMVVVDSRDRPIRAALEQCDEMPSMLVLDDLEALQHYLQQRDPHVKKWHGPRPVLILLNVDLGRPDVREVLQALKADPGVRPIPMLALANKQDPVGYAYDLGINACIMRPETLEEQVRVVGVLASFWFYVATLPNYWFANNEANYRAS